MREAWRRYAHAFLTPGGGDPDRRAWRPVGTRPASRLDLPALFASDITGRARAFAAMVQTGMDVERAAALSGLLAGE